MKNLVIDEIADYESYCQYRERNATEYAKRYAAEKALASTKQEFSVPGWCYLCQKEVKFAVGYEHSFQWEGELMPNFREYLSCSCCGFGNRMRAIVHVLEQRLKLSGEVYITEQVTALYSLLKKRITNVVGSEYLGMPSQPGTGNIPGTTNPISAKPKLFFARVKKKLGLTSGSKYVATVPEFGMENGSGVRNESITKLTFDTNHFNVILSFDVLEHVPEYLDGFRECWRSLKPGGTLFFTVPFTGLEKTITRARINSDGSITHILPAEYHGDPLKNEGCLCFHHFGWDMLGALRSIGFVDVFALIYYSNEFGYLGKGEQIIFTASKPK
ncbi:MAG: methyltransferase domain-containing protein [Halieaceae bacterium]|nr:methyltransferase domain-containing protein [Halieaceae bacterium]